MLVLDDAYVGKTGLDKAVVSLTGTETARFCAQKNRNSEPKKAAHKNALEQKKPLVFWEAAIHDFHGHLTLNGGRYRLPFSIPVPANVAPSLELAPVEHSLFEVNYKVKVTVTECADTKAKKKGGLLQGGVPLIENTKPITILSEPAQAP